MVVPHECRWPPNQWFATCQLHWHGCGTASAMVLATASRSASLRFDGTTWSSQGIDERTSRHSAAPPSSESARPMSNVWVETCTGAPGGRPQLTRFVEALRSKPLDRSMLASTRLCNNYHTKASGELYPWTRWITTLCNLTLAKARFAAGRGVPY